MAIIQTTEYDDIRFLVSEELTKERVSDARIQSDTILGRATTDILSRLNITEGQFAQQSAAQQLKIKNAIKYETAAILIPIVQILLSESTVGTTFRFEEKDWMERITMLRNEANTLVPPTSVTGRLRQVFELY